MKIFVAVLVVALVLGALYWLYLQPRRAQALSPDGQVIEQLAKANSDLSKPHDIDFFFYFSSREAADAAMKELRSSLEFSKVEITGNNNAWGLQLTRSMLPTEAALMALRSSFTQVAVRHGGEYDGWGAAVGAAPRSEK
jgi:hypothetical protein